MKKKLTSAIVAVVVSLTMVGCLSSAYHFGGENDYPYNATSDCCVSCLGVWGHEPKNEVENAIDAYTKMVYPFWIVDFPLEIVLDTAFMPFDAIILCCDDGKDEGTK